MNYTNLLLCLFGITACFLAGSVAHEAIVGGSFAKLEKFRYQASILQGIPHSKFPVIHCGAGIIKDLFVLTAAHCVIEPLGELMRKPTIYVYVETVDLHIPGKIIEIEKVYVPKKFKHPTYSKNTAGDIAVLKLKRSLLLEKHHLNLHLPECDTTSYDYQTARIAGFGWDQNSHHYGKNAQYLQFTDVEVRNNSKCKRDHPNETISETEHFCARVKQQKDAVPRGVCVNDDGSPLVLYDQKIVIGILITCTRTCNELKSSGIYLNVARYRGFILNAIDNIVTEDMHVIEV